MLKKNLASALDRQTMLRKRGLLIILLSIPLLIAATYTDNSHTWSPGSHQWVKRETCNSWHSVKNIQEDSTERQILLLHLDSFKNKTVATNMDEIRLTGGNQDNFNEIDKWLSNFC